MIRDDLAPCLQLEEWLREVSKLCMRKNKRVEFNAPQGSLWRLVLSLRVSRKVNSDLHVKARKFAEEADSPRPAVSQATTIAALPLTPCMPLMPRSATRWSSDVQL